MHVFVLVFMRTPYVSIYNLWKIYHEINNGIEFINN